MIILFGYQLQLRDKILVCDRSSLAAQDCLVLAGGPGAIQETHTLTSKSNNL